MNADAPERDSFFYRFYRALIPPALGLFAILGYYAIFGDLQPAALEEKYSFFVRALGVLVIAPFSFALGFLVMRRTRGNLIGPAIVLWGGVASSELATGFLPPFLGALSIFYVMVVVFPALFLMLGVFPTGRGATPLLDRAMKTTTLVTFLICLLFNLAAPRAYGLSTPSPLAIPALLPHFESFNRAVTPLFGFSLLLALGSLVQRYRISNAVRRKQMRWLVLFVVYFFLQILVGPLIYQMMIPLINDVFTLTILAVPPAVIGVAILRHRLWDIDLFIRRTLQYAILSAVLGLVYFGGIVVLQAAFSGMTGRSDSPLITVVTTLAIAALFNPLRLRIQHFIDRRFYRQRYDAAQALERFSLAARDEVDLDRLSVALVEMVRQTMAPEKASLWLKRESLSAIPRAPSTTRGRANQS